ncbi:MAG: primosomal protein N', partial [Pseudomonadota bacterium]
LEKKGRLKIEERRVYRDSLGRAVSFESRPPVLSEEQAAAAASLTAALNRRTFSPFVLYGVTGSGKTEVYLAAAAESLAQGRTVLILVPEISLTPVLEGRLRARFGEEVGVLHSGLSDGERYDEWLKIKRREVRLVLGARSAVFAPLEDLGLIVVDEEHDGAYKQDEGLRYNARDLAVYRARQASALVILGSATPSLETFYAAKAGRYKLLRLPSRFGLGRLPRIDVVDMRLDTGRRRPVLTPIMKKALADALERKEQALLFINRRGTAGLAICMSCGQVVKCLNCSVTLTLHQSAVEPEALAGPDKGRLNCHYCGFEIEPPRRCQACGTGRIIYLGIGTERLEKEVQKAFPEARVGRLDADTARPKGELTRILTRLRDQELDVLVGTQMITKGHHFPNITLVGVIEADLGLHRPDFRAGERTFQLLAQVSGRAGRGEAPGRVIVQTYTPEHYTLLLAEKHDYLGFFEEELAQRLELDYPPFSRLALARFQGNSEAQARDKAEESAVLGRQLIESGRTPEVDLLGPAPAPLPKIKGKHRFQILIRAAKVQALQRFLDQWLNRIQPRLKGQAVSVSIDVDPYQMM